MDNVQPPYFFLIKRLKPKQVDMSTWLMNFFNGFIIALFACSHRAPVHSSNIMYLGNSILQIVNNQIM